MLKALVTQCSAVFMLVTMIWTRFLAADLNLTEQQVRISGNSGEFEVEWTSKQVLYHSHAMLWDKFETD